MLSQQAQSNTGDSNTADIELSNFAEQDDLCCCSFRVTNMGIYYRSILVQNQFMQMDLLQSIDLLIESGVNPHKCLTSLLTERFN